MTTVKSVQDDAPIGEAQAVDKVRGRKRLLAFLTGSALLLACGNLITSVYLLRSTSELRAIDTRLQGLADLEARLKYRIEVAGNGIQSRIDQYQSDLRSRLVGLENNLSSVDRILRQEALDPASSQVAGFQNRTMRDSRFDLPQGIDLGATARTETTQLASADPSMPASNVSSSYQRIDAPDGKVIYKRIR